MDRVSTIDTWPAGETIQLQQKLARVHSVLEAARKVHATIRLEEVLTSVLELAAKELEAQGAFLVSSLPGLDTRGAVYGHLPGDWTRWTPRTPLTGYASAPLKDADGTAFAHLVVFRPVLLSLEEEDFLEGLALQSALAVRNALHHQRAIEWERIRVDLDAARAIQSSLLPQSVPGIEGYSLSFRSTPCYEVGGDYVDLVPLPGGRLMMTVADVAGKGLASALISMSFRSNFRAIGSEYIPLAEMAERLNALHWQEGPEARRRYVTAILVRLDPREHSIEAVNAGHTPGFLAAKCRTVSIDASGPPLGMFPSSRYEAVTFSLPPLSQLMLYTDGLTEVFRGAEEFGHERLLGLMGAIPRADFLDRVWTAVEDFAGDARPADDRTALYLCRAAEQIVPAPTPRIRNQHDL